MKKVAQTLFLITALALPSFAFAEGAQPAPGTAQASPDAKAKEATPPAKTTAKRKTTKSDAKHTRQAPAPKPQK